MVIAIDHGNKQIKTAHHTFTSGLVESNSPPALGGKAIRYGDKFYSLSEKRIRYMRDKTVDERFFILTLFGIFQELETTRGYVKGREEVTLLIGLPPAHFGAQRKKFTQYFSRRGEIHCQYNGEPHVLTFSQVYCYPQAYAAAMLQYKELMACPRCRIIDVGGFTVDYLQTIQGNPDMSMCGSLENGVITFYDRVSEDVNASFDRLLDEVDVDAILRGSEGYPAEIVEYVDTSAQRFVDDLANRFREMGMNLRLGKLILAGGGAVLLKPFLAKSPMFSGASYVEGVNANVRGYEFLYRASKG